MCFESFIAAQTGTGSGRWSTSLAAVSVESLTHPISLLHASLVLAITPNQLEPLMEGRQPRLHPDISSLKS